jgi:hypothetical protein
MLSAERICSLVPVVGIRNWLNELQVLGVQYFVTSATVHMPPEESIGFPGADGVNKQPNTTKPPPAQRITTHHISLYIFQPITALRLLHSP